MVQIATFGLVRWISHTCKNSLLASRQARRWKYYFFPRSLRSVMLRDPWCYIVGIFPFRGKNESFSEGNGKMGIFRRSWEFFEKTDKSRKNRFWRDFWNEVRAFSNIRRLFKIKILIKLSLTAFAYCKGEVVEQSYLNILGSLISPWCHPPWWCGISMQCEDKSGWHFHSRFSGLVAGLLVGAFHLVARCGTKRSAHARAALGAFHLRKKTGTVRHDSAELPRSAGARHRRKK